MVGSAHRAPEGDRRLDRGKADFEYLYDKPYVDKDRIRVAGPFTVESLSPHRTLAVDWNDELIDTPGRRGQARGRRTATRRRPISRR